MNKRTFGALLVGIFLPCLSQLAQAWHNDLSIVNNTEVPLRFMIDTEQGGAHPDPFCYAKEGIPPQRSCHITLTDSYKFPEGTGHKGMIHVIKPDGEFCIIDYNYIYNALASYSKKRSVKLRVGSCTPGFDKQGLSFVNDELKKVIRPMLSQLDYPFIAEDLQKSTESFSTADCADPSTGEENSDNCVIVTPTDPSLLNGSTLFQGLSIQNTIDKYEPISHAQWIGTHNSMISPVYTQSTKIANVSHSDPNNYASLTQQLDAGIRMIEFDILRDSGEIKLCHDHLNIPKPLNKIISKMMCDNNATLAMGVDELKYWLKDHPEQMIIVYLDVNQTLRDHEEAVERAFAGLENKIFMPEDAKKLYRQLTGKETLPEHTLPTDLFSKNDILKTGKQVIVVTSPDDEYLGRIKYVFLHNNHNASDLLYQNAVSHFDGTELLCNGAKKYESVQHVFENDPGHFDAWRSNGDRTVIGYLSGAHGKTSRYNDYWSLATIKAMQKCPINIISLNMFGMNCNLADLKACQYAASAYEKRPIDPRLVALLWSWERGYPLASKAGQNQQAYLMPSKGQTTIHFQNRDALASNVQHVLCHVNPSAVKEFGPDEWFLMPFKSGDSPEQQCKQQQGRYAVPVTSYQMDDVWLMLKQTQPVLDHPILVNYRFDPMTGWTANHGEALLGSKMASPID